jgi:hypothetical protein
VKVARASTNTVWELKLELGLMTGGEATAGEMATQNSRITASMAASRQRNVSGLVRRGTVTLGGEPVIVLANAAAEAGRSGIEFVFIV